MSLEEIHHLPVDNITPNRFQPRVSFQEDSLKDLAASIQSVGLIHPISVRAPDAHGRYEIIAGERRWRAVCLLGQPTIRALVREASDEQVALEALIENIQRAELNPIEEARGVARLMEEFHLTQAEVAERLGRSRGGIGHLAGLLTLAPGVQAMVREGHLSFSHARALVGQIPSAQTRLAAQVVKHGLSLRALENKIRREVRAAAPGTQIRRDPDIEHLETTLSEHVHAITRIDYDPQHQRTRITFDFVGEGVESFLDLLQIKRHWSSGEDE